MVTLAGTAAAAAAVTPVACSFALSPRGSFRPVIALGIRVILLRRLLVFAVRVAVIFVPSGRLLAPSIGVAVVPIAARRLLMPTVGVTVTFIVLFGSLLGCLPRRPVRWRGSSCVARSRTVPATAAGGLAPRTRVMDGEGHCGSWKKRNELLNTK